MRSWPGKTNDETEEIDFSDMHDFNGLTRMAPADHWLGVDLPWSAVLPTVPAGVPAGWLCRVDPLTAVSVTLAGGTGAMLVR